MEENQKQIEVASIDQSQGSGAILAAERKQQNKTVEEIAADLNLSVTQVKTIELDQTDGLPEPTYVRGYIRSYAKLLGLSPDEVLLNYLNPSWQQTGSLNDIPKGIGASTEDSDRGFFTPVKSITLLVLFTALAYFWYSGGLASLMGSEKPTVISQQASETTDLITSSVQSETVVGSAQTATPALLEDDAALPDSQEHQLVLNFNETSWVDIRDDEETRLAYKSYAPGETLDVSSANPLRVFIGNAAGVSVEYNGLPFDIGEHREGVYAKFVIGE
jgi:cytoskeleton protein RodZ